MSRPRREYWYDRTSTLWVDDPEAPCAYDVGWDEAVDPYQRKARPYWPDGSTVRRMYINIHADCEEAVMAYASERTT